MGSHHHPFGPTDPAIAVLETDAGRCVVRLSGEHDISTEPELRAVLDRAIGLGASAIVVDLGGVRFMDASTLRVIVDASNSMQISGRTLTVRSAGGSALRLISMFGLHGLIEREVGRQVDA